MLGTSIRQEHRNVKQNDPKFYVGPAQNMIIIPDLSVFYIKQGLSLEASEDW